MALHKFPVTKEQRDAQQADSALSISYWARIYTPDQIAARFPSVILQFGPALMRKRVRDRNETISAIWG